MSDTENYPNHFNDEASQRKELERILHMIQMDQIDRTMQLVGICGSNELSKEERAKRKQLCDVNQTGPDARPILLSTFRLLHDRKEIAQFVGMLLTEGADANIFDSDTGLTPLMYACRMGMERAAKELIQCPKTDLLLRDPFGNTALMLAAYNNHPTIVRHYCKELIKREKRSEFGGIDPLDSTNDEGETALSMSRAMHHEDCTRILQAAKSKRLKSLSRSLSINSSLNKLTALALKRRPVSRAISFDNLLTMSDDEDEQLISRSTSNYRSQKRSLQHQSSLDRNASRNESPLGHSSRDLEIDVGVRLRNHPAIGRKTSEAAAVRKSSRREIMASSLLRSTNEMMTHAMSEKRPVTSDLIDFTESGASASESLTAGLRGAWSRRFHSSDKRHRDLSAHEDPLMQSMNEDPSRTWQGIRVNLTIDQSTPSRRHDWLKRQDTGPGLLHNLSRNHGGRQLAPLAKLESNWDREGDKILKHKLPPIGAKMNKADLSMLEFLKTERPKTSSKYLPRSLSSSK